MEEAPDNGKESSYSAHANGMNMTVIYRIHSEKGFVDLDSVYRR
jgi:hypothetical protein